MIHAALKYVVPFSALLAVGPLAGRLTGVLRGVDGGGEASLLVGASPSAGVLAGAGAMGLAAIMGCIGSRLIGKRMGLFCAGLVLAWAAWGTGRVDLIMGQPGMVAPLRMLGLEGAMVGAMGVLAAAAILWTPTMRSALPGARDPEHQHHHLPQEPMTLLDGTVPLAVVAAMLGAAVGVWLLAQETLKGQTFGAAAVAGVLGAGAGRMASQRISAVWFFLAIGALGAVSPIVASVFHSTPEGAVRAALAGRLFVLARPLPLDMMAGAFVGVPMGLAWVGSLVDRQQPHATPAAR
jgi:hypothetical protein